MRCAISCEAPQAIGRVADFILASSDVKGVFAARRESLSISSRKRARSAGYIEFAAARRRKIFFCAAGARRGKIVFDFACQNSARALRKKMPRNAVHFARLHHAVEAKRANTWRRSHFSKPAARYISNAGEFAASTASTIRSTAARRAITCACCVICRPQPRPRTSGTSPMYTSSQCRAWDDPPAATRRRPRRRCERFARSPAGKRPSPDSQRSRHPFAARR